MDRHVRLRELLVAVEGLALLRHLYDGTDDAAEERLEEVRRILEDERFLDGAPMREADAATGYRAWSSSYDEPGNPIIALEQPAVWSVLDSIQPGRALDAACGTGRHARRLLSLGHDVVGIDLTPAMLELAASSAPQARFVEGDLLAVPCRDAEFDLVVCGLALSHLADVHVAVAELARVLRPGGQIVVSVLHPLHAHLGWHAPFTDSHGHRGFVREHAHSHADYFDAFRAAGLELTGCDEPRLGPEHVQAKRRAFEHVPGAVLQAYVGLPGVLVWCARKPAA